MISDSIPKLSCMNISQKFQIPHHMVRVLYHRGHILKFYNPLMTIVSVDFFFLIGMILGQMELFYILD